jgi:7-carboxy-7-deazaguanine synthase
MKVCEIFASIQGESTFSGLPCSFVRFAGCNLRCTYCDTRYAYDEGYHMTESEIVQRIGSSGLNLVAITGGEPLLQHEVYHLIQTLLDDGRRVLVETNGSLSLRQVDRRATVILDIKTPGSGMSDRMDFSNLGDIRKHDEIKFVVSGRADYVWTKDIVRSFNLVQKCTILMSPAFGLLRPEDLARWMLDDRLAVRLNLQLHKYIFGPDKRGV